MKTSWLPMSSPCSGSPIMAASRPTYFCSLIPKTAPAECEDEEEEFGKAGRVDCGLDEKPDSLAVVGFGLVAPAGVLVVGEQVVLSILMANLRGS
ncbi:hypothetical protein B0H63DRAFT_564436 [Podospora didyma]|uniref:Uncharacterized protein n=1 Tax=Podospora didyma TaxID=330526 RepID=A0AAE0K5W1_9PEZI|nr:hypothetical protein B0H63DRAFT_564436 [Podospora didyma]